MSTDGSSMYMKEIEAAQALLDLKIAIIRGSTNERKIADDHQECVEPVAQQPIKVMTSYEVGTVSRIHAVTNITTTESDVATTRSPKRKNPDHEVKNHRQNNRHNHTHHSEESTNRRSKIFKSKPIKYVTVTSGPGSSFVSSRDSAKQDNASKVSVTKMETRDVRTQTDDNQNLAIAQVQKQLSLKELKKTKSQVVETDDHDVSGNVNGDDDESNEMTIDYSDASESDMDNRAGQCNENSIKILSNRSVNANADDLVPIGNGNALIPSRIFSNVNWTSYTCATRKLLMAVFPRSVLATHSLTGKPSPAFPNKPAKKKLDPALVNDIVQTVAERCCIADNLVRNIITIKCADESKMFRTREINKNKSKPEVKENIPPESDSD